MENEASVNFCDLVRRIAILSEQTDEEGKPRNWGEIRKQWTIIDMFEESDGMCFCGCFPISFQFRIQNEKTLLTATVGSTCVMHFRGNREDHEAFQRDLFEELSEVKELREEQTTHKETYDRSDGFIVSDNESIPTSDDEVILPVEEADYISSGEEDRKRKRIQAKRKARRVIEDSESEDGDILADVIRERKKHSKKHKRLRPISFKS